MKISRMGWEALAQWGEDMTRVAPAPHVVGDAASERAEIEARAVARWAEIKRQGFAPRHFQTNTRLEYVDADRLRGRTQLLLVWVAVETRTAQIQFVADYFDEFERTEAGWRFAVRRIG